MNELSLLWPQLFFFDNRRKLAYDIFDRVKTRYGDLVWNTRISENVALAISPMHGLDVFANAPNSSGEVEYKALTIELIKVGSLPKGKNNNWEK